MNAFVDIIRLSKAYKQGSVATPVLRDVSMSFSRGSFSAIVGPSGCGKTTLLSVLGALDSANTGSVIVDGVDLLSATSRELIDYRRRSVGIIFQFFNLLPSLTVVENVESGLEFLSLKSSQRRARAMDYLARVGMVELASRFPAQLSGGQQQRVAVARVLAREPKLILADEPTGNLDEESGTRIFECMRTLQRESGVTCIMVTHDLALAASTDEVVRLRDGRVVEEQVFDACEFEADAMMARGLPPPWMNASSSGRTSRTADDPDHLDHRCGTVCDLDRQSPTVSRVNAEKTAPNPRRSLARINGTQVAVGVSMKSSHCLSFVLAVATTAAVHAGTSREAAAETKAAASSLSASQLVAKVDESDPWGLGGAEVSAKAIVTEKTGKTRALVFQAKSRRYAPPLGKSIITFQAPADVAGMKFLQIQNAGSDDDRFLYTPELKRSRRIAGSNRSDSFMGTDFSYADIDGRDLRQSTSVLKGDEMVGKFDCFRVSVTPTNGDAVYSKIDLWVRKDNYVPLKWVMFDKKSNPVKTLVAKEIQKHAGHWFITGTRMTDNATGRSTELTLEKVDRRDDIPMDSFSVRAIEKG